MYHYIFFDLDGTLTDSKEGILNSLRYAFDKLGEPVPPESTLIKFIGPPLQDSFAEFCGFSAERAAEAIAAFRERYEPVGKFENMAAPGMADLCARLNDFYFQFQKLGNNYNQIVKAINAHFSNVAIPHQIAMLEQRTRELKALSIEILNLAKQAKEWLRI